jgi:Aspartyl protease
MPDKSRRILLLGLAGWCGPALACAPRQRATVALDVVPGAILVSVEVNGASGTFILDTGAQRSVVTPAAVARLGLSLDEWVGTTMRGIGGIDRRRNATPRSLSLGGVALHRRTLTRDTSLAVTTLARTEAGGRVIDGLLGRDYLSLFDLDLDGPARRLTLFDAAGCGGRFLPWPDAYTVIPAEMPAESAMLLPVSIDGVRLRALLDTGASSSLIAAPGMVKLNLTPERLAQDPVETISGAGPRAVAVFRHRFRTMRIGDQTLTAPDLWVGATRLAPVADMLLGADWLLGQRVWISYASKQVFVSGN